MLIVCPSIRNASAARPLAAASDSIEMPFAAATDESDSPQTTVCSAPPPEDDVPPSAAGMLIVCPSIRNESLERPFAAASDSIEIPFAAATEESDSPQTTVCEVPLDVLVPLLLVETPAEASAAAPSSTVGTSIVWPSTTIASSDSPLKTATVRVVRLFA